MLYWVLTWKRQEDLQKFQANHFGASTSLVGHPGPLQSDLVEEHVESYDQDDNLGYYKDGTKRTLTHEQIQIFRHSEIHALLRERERLREEEAEEQSDAEEIQHKPADSVRISKDDGDTQNEPADNALKRKSVEGNEGSATKRAKDDGSTARPTDGDNTPASTHQPSQKSFRDFNSGRKIVSYADDWWKIIRWMDTLMVSHEHINKPFTVSPGYMMKTFIVILSRTLYPQYLDVSISWYCRLCIAMTSYNLLSDTKPLILIFELKQKHDKLKLIRWIGQHSWNRSEIFGAQGPMTDQSSTFACYRSSEFSFDHG